MAAFLFIAGITGALIAWDHELDAWLNPSLYRANATATPLDPLDLADRYEQDNRSVLVRYLPLAVEEGHALHLGVTGRIDPQTSKPHELEFNEVSLDPATGEVQATREWGKFAVDRKHIMPFLYELHYSLHLPELDGFEFGVLAMGVLAIAWVLDCFVALIIAFPNRKVWKRSLQFRWKPGGHKLNFDLHRSGGVWTWLVMLILAITAVSMNLGEQVVRPVVSLFSPLSPDPFAGPDPAQFPDPQLDRRAAIARAVEHARAQGISAPAGGIFYVPERGMYGVGFFEPGDDHADGKLGNPWLYIDGVSGALHSSLIPGRGSAGDVFMQLQFPLHSGRLFGVVGRAIISVLGIGVAVLSATGVILWARRTRRVRHPGGLPAQHAA